MYEEFLLLIIIRNLQFFNSNYLFISIIRGAYSVYLSQPYVLQSTKDYCNTLTKLKPTHKHISNFCKFFVNHSFIYRRSFQIKINQTLSSIKLLEAGVPQGFPLSPLFYIYMADVPYNRHTSLYIYTDDTAIIAQSKDIQTLTNYITAHYEELKTWYQKWKIQINLEKAELTALGIRKVPPTRSLIIDNLKLT